MARVELLDIGQMEPELQKVLRKMEGNGYEVLNIHKALAHAPELCAAFVRMANKLLFRTKIEPKLRELAILRVARLTKARYEREQHEAVARELGMPDLQIDAVKKWQGSRHFDKHEQTVLQFTDELTGQVRAKNSTYKKLQAFLSEREIVELTLTVGFYNMVSRFLEALEVDLDEARFKVRV
jgi:alkylhydroperoxidase family enzyme